MERSWCGAGGFHVPDDSYFARAAAGSAAAGRVHERAYNESDFARRRVPCSVPAEHLQREQNHGPARTAAGGQQGSCVAAARASFDTGAPVDVVEQAGGTGHSVDENWRHSASGSARTAAGVQVVLAVAGHSRYTAAGAPVVDEHWHRSVHDSAHTAAAVLAVDEHLNHSVADSGSARTELRAQVVHRADGRR